MGESLYGDVDKDLLAFKNIVSCAYKEVGNNVVSGPEYKMILTDDASEVYHNLTFLDTSETIEHLPTFSCDKLTVYDAGGSKYYQRNYDNFVNIYADAQANESASSTPLLIILLEATTIIGILVGGLLVRCVA